MKAYVEMGVEERRYAVERMAKFCGRELVPEGQIARGKQVAFVNGELVTGYPYLDVWNPFLNAQPLEEVKQCLDKVSRQGWKMIRGGADKSVVVDFACEPGRHWIRGGDTEADAIHAIVKELQERQQANTTSDIEIQLEAARKRDEG